MGRSKPVPKRRRVDVEQEEQHKSIALLSKLPLEDVEKAAVEVMRGNLSSWDQLRQGTRTRTSHSDISPSFEGLGTCSMVARPKDFLAFTQLHDIIKEKAPASTSWSGSSTDPRKRAFGFVPGSLGYLKAVRQTLDISTPDASATDAAQERPRNTKAMVVLENNDIPQLFPSALERLLEQLRPLVTPPSLRTYLSLKHLVAAQPNLHEGSHLLPMHVDHPSKDGFGIVIVTIAIRGSATILLETSDRKHRLAVELEEKSAYMLAGTVRNACVHGVLADESSGHRESLNLRFGLHGYHNGDPLADTVLRHWKDDGL